MSPAEWRKRRDELHCAAEAALKRLDQTAHAPHEPEELAEARNAYFEALQQLTEFVANSSVFSRLYTAADKEPETAREVWITG